MDLMSLIKFAIEGSMELYLLTVKLKHCSPSVFSLGETTSFFGV
jgi:hypothetical protein